jgi:hypothetical protein
MRISGRVLLLLGNAALGVVLLIAQPRDLSGHSGPRTGCCRFDTMDNGVCCVDCCAVLDGCRSSAACPRKIRAPF